MRSIPRRSQPSWIGRLGRSIIAAGPFATVAAGSLFLCLFVLLTLPVVLTISNANGGGLSGGADPGNGPNGPEGPQETLFEKKLRRANDSIGKLLGSLQLPTGIQPLEVTSMRTVDGNTFSHRYREVTLDSGEDLDKLLMRFRETVAEPQERIDVLESVFDSKASQVLVLVDGIPTHIIILSKSRLEDDSGQVVVTSLPEQAVVVPERLRKGAPEIAIIIDDIGFRTQIENALLEIDAPITFSVMPFTPGGAEFARRAHEKGREIMLHMPMEPIDFPAKQPGRGALYVTDTFMDVARSLETAFADVPYIVGVNNHMGSKYTQNRELMLFTLERIRERGLFFVDSLTHSKSVGYELAQQIGLKSAIRNVFLDHDTDFRAVASQIGELVSVAETNGYAVGIGHPHITTLEALKTYLPGLKERGIRIVPVSELAF